MLKFFGLFFSILLLVSLAKPGLARMMEFSPEMTFLDLEDITNLFHKDHKQTVHIIDNPDSPVKILKAEISDKGTRRFKDLKDGVDNYQVKVQNISNRTILAYEVTWTLRHPFEDYTLKEITANSIKKLGPLKTQKLEFRRDIYYRDDAYYYAEITKVQFNDDESVWEAPDREDTLTRFDAIQKEIETIEEKTLEEMSTEELIEKTGASLINGSSAE